jgi:hypothetical protein
VLRAADLAAAFFAGGVFLVVFGIGVGRNPATLPAAKGKRRDRPLL